MFTGYGPDTIDMVAVLVGNNNGLQIGGSQSETPETLARLGFGKSTVEQDAGIARLNKRGITATATAQ